MNAEWLLAILLPAFLCGVLVGVSVGVGMIWWDKKLHDRFRHWQNWRKNRK